MDFKTDLKFDGKVDLDFGATGPKQKITAAESMGLKAGTVRTVTRHRKFYDLSRVPNAVKLVKPLPDEGETIHALMGGDFHAWDLIPAIHGLLSCPISELYITTLGFNHSNNQHLCDMIDAGQVQTAYVLCSEYFRDADRDVYNAAEKRLAERGSMLKAVRNHSKIIAIRPADRLPGWGWRARYTVESSANLRSCNNLEQFTLTNDAALFEFHTKWIRAQFK
jgi:hypothetical protein